MIRVLHVISDVNIGGAGLQLVTLLEGLDKSIFKVKVILPQNSMLINKLKNINIQYEEILYLAEKSFSVLACCVLYKKIKTYKPHLVHTHAAFSARIAAKMYGKCKIVHTRHSVFPLTKKQKIFKFFIRFVENLLGQRVIAVSPAAVDNLVQMGVCAEKIDLIYNGVKQVKKYDEEEIKLLKKKYGIPNDVFIVAKIARLTEVKGHDYVLDAAKNTDAQFLFAGDGEYRKHLEARVANEKITNVRILGHVDEVHEIMNIMDAQVLASFGTDATSLALLEGMSLGKPAIVTDFGGNPYVITNGVNGIVVPKKNALKLKDGINKIMMEKEFYDMCAKGAVKIFNDVFTAEIMINKTMDLYKKLIGG